MSIALKSETKLLTLTQAADWLRERFHVGSKSWLAALSVKWEGPAFFIVGKQAIYHPDDLAGWIEQRFLSAKAVKHSAPVHQQVGASAEPVEGLTFEEPLAVEPEDTYLPGVNTDAIELGLRLAAQLGA